MILVTGHVGFIGSHLYRALEAAGENVVGADPRGKWGDHDVAHKIGDNLTAIFHLGAISDTTCQSDKLLYENNEAPTRLLARFCREKNIPFIWASSASVYGNGDGPLNQYARSKQASEAMLEGGDGIWYALRLHNVYGPGEEHKGEQRSMVSKAIDAYRNGEAPRFYDLSAQRDFVYVEDVVDVMLQMWRAKPPSGIYDVGTGINWTIQLMCDIIQKEMNISHEPIEIGVPPEARGKLQTSTRADIQKLLDVGILPPSRWLKGGVREMLAV